MPGRRYGRRVVQKPIKGEEVLRTLSTLAETREEIHLLYLLILYSGARFHHVHGALRAWTPEEEIYVAWLNRTITRLECPGTHCRYYLGLEREIKPAAFIFFPRTLLPEIEEYREVLPSPRWIQKIAQRLGILSPKYIRTYALRELKRVFGDTDLYRFIAGKFGELTVSARHYSDLLQEADEAYPKYIKHIRAELGID